jgi:hypothetical protein
VRSIGGVNGFEGFQFAMALTLAVSPFAACESAPEETDPRTDIQFVQMTTVQPVRPSSSTKECANAVGLLNA